MKVSQFLFRLCVFRDIPYPRLLSFPGLVGLVLMIHPDGEKSDFKKFVHIYLDEFKNLFRR